MSTATTTESGQTITPRQGSLAWRFAELSCRQTLLCTMIDRARVHVRSQGPRIEGETRVLTTIGPWIDCRMAPDTEDEVYRDDHMEKINVRNLMLAPTAQDGSVVDIAEKDLVEVEFGRTIDPGFTHPSPQPQNREFTPAGLFRVVNSGASHTRSAQTVGWTLKVAKKDEW